MEYEATVLGCEMTHPRLTSRMKEEEPEMYRFGVVLVAVIELDHGMKIKRINKPTEAGTGIVYERIETAEEAEAYIKGLTKELKETTETIKNMEGR